MKTVRIGIANKGDYLHGLKKQIPFVHNDIRYEFGNYAATHIDNSEIKSNFDLVLVPNREPHGWDYDYDDNLIKMNWWPKHLQQRRIKKAVDKSEYFQYIDTYSINFNFIESILNASRDYVVKGICVKPSNGSAGVGVAFYDFNAPELSRYACYNAHREFILEKHKLPSEEFIMPVTLIAQPHIEFIDEWRLIYLGDDFIWAKRKVENNKGTTKGQDDPYKTTKVYSNEFKKITGLDITTVISDLLEVCEKVGMSVGSSIDIGSYKRRATVEPAIKFAIIEFQPQFGDTEMSWKIRDKITRSFIEKVIEPKLKDLEIINEQ